MAPRQLLLELEEVEISAEKGSKIVRVDRADESSMQLALPVHWPELCLALAPDTGSECSKDTFGSRSTPQYYHSLGCPLKYSTGSSTFQSDFRLIR
eukprot:scaffold2630_cov118-Isochrysis_galbana.AAC.3